MGRGGGGGGLTRGITIPQYEFALKMQGGLMREGGRICGTLRYMPSQFTDAKLSEYYQPNEADQPGPNCGQ